MVQPSRGKRFLHYLMALSRPTAAIQVEAIPVLCRQLPQAFAGARIAVVSDVHFPDAAVEVHRLVSCVALQRPDAIFLTGDLTNSYAAFDADNLRRLVQELTAIAPCYAIPGNHELRLRREPLYRQILEDGGVHYLYDSFADWEKEGAVIRLFGMARRRPAPLRLEDQPSIVLAHKPHHLAYYAAAKWDVVICGHAHGGQIRVAGKAVYSPGQGLFPAYTDGVYRRDGTTMVVSRGLGNSSIPWRIANTPHLPVVILLPQTPAAQECENL